MLLGDLGYNDRLLYYLLRMKRMTEKIIYTSVSLYLYF